MTTFDIILIELALGGLLAYYRSGEQRFKKWRYILPFVGGWMALIDSVKSRIQ